MAWFPAVWGKEQGFTLNVLSASLMLFFASRLGPGPIVIAQRLMPFFTLINDVLLSPHLVPSAPSPYFLTLEFVLTTLSTHVPYLIPKSLSNILSILNSLSDSKVVNLFLMDTWSFFPSRQRLADCLAKVGATHDPSIIPLSLSPLILPTFIPLKQLETPFFRSNPSSIF